MALHEGDLEHYPRKFGKYHLLGPLAQGGMGALYLAVAGDRGLERLMVIKTVLPHLADAEYVARFRDEAKVVVKLSHGNLIPVFDAGLVGGELFLAMDFVEGRDLRAVWNRCAKKQVAFPIDVAVYIVKELCRGLAYAHSFPDLNLVHRDVSPPNVLVSYTGEVKLTDFGLASSTLKLEKTAPGIIYGKVAYMSPEQARGEKLDGRSDMYAAAIVLWELLTGRQLFPPGKDQPQDLLARAKNPDVMRPSKRAPRVPVELDEICVRALASKREDRYADCDEMRMALQTWLAHNAPTTDGTRMSTFLQDLFAEDIQRERGERNELLTRVRTRALTLPPTDELRQMVEQSGSAIIPMDDLDVAATDAPVRRPGSIGRRSTDRGDDGNDRRQKADRRSFRSSPASGNDSSAVASATALATAPQTDAEPDLIGLEIDGRYRIVELIGEGGMGKVYLAEHIEIGKRVALKVLHQSYSRMPDLVERFRREARAASKIGHPNIVDVTDSGTTEDGSVYFVMEYLEGVELGSVIEREGAIDVARALRIAGQICRALAAAHTQGIVHRDLKPENIFLITRDGATDVVKVLDFGIAKTTEAEAARERRLTSPGMAMGTPEYMAPEQAAGRAADARCDIYALGAIMYEMCTGIPPYTGDNFMEILTKKATVDPPHPVKVRSELPAPVGDLVMAAMARDPNNRPQTMEALEYELTKCLAGRGVAVAQILGMSSDANIVASLNPGLSMRNLDDGIVSSRSATSSPSLVPPRAITHPVAHGLLTGDSGEVGEVTTGGQAAISRAVDPSTSGQLPRAHTPLPIQTMSGDLLLSEPVLVKRSALGTFGWLVLGALLFGGVGAVVYVAVGERQSEIAAVSAPAVAPDPKPPAKDPGSREPLTPVTAGVGVPAPVPDKPDDEETPSSATDAGVDAAKDPKQAADRPPRGKRGARAQAKRAAAAEQKDAQLIEALRKQGSEQERAKKWTPALETYRKLEKLKGQAGYAAFRMGWIQLERREYDAAAGLFQRAANHDKALYFAATKEAGTAQLRNGEPERAKQTWLRIYKNAVGESQVELERKIAEANKALKLPLRDGLYNPSP
ncbi:MAG: protein kinase [Kofleriaceae bacterium]